MAQEGAIINGPLPLAGEHILWMKEEVGNVSELVCPCIHPSVVFWHAAA